MRVAIIGVGGFANDHHRSIRALETAGECKLVCTCDPNAELLKTADEKYDLTGRGVKTYANYLEMLDTHDGELDVVTVPTPIPLHAEMHRACVERGLACYLEKPPTLDPDELEQMVVTDQSAKSQTQVGFNFIVEEKRQALKARVLAGEFGKLKRVVFLGLWPRPTTYYGRNNWAGKLLAPDGRLLLDSCLANAQAHYVHNLFYWAGTNELASFASLASVQAELYRAHAIESYDTGFLKAICENGIELRIVGTHACTGDHFHYELVECENATIRYSTWHDYDITSADGTVIERGDADRGDLLQANFRHYFSHVRGEITRPLTRFVDSRPFVHLNDLAYIASGTIHPVAPEHVRTEGDFREIAGIADACKAFVKSGAFPSEHGIAWAQPGKATVTPDDLGRLRETVSQNLL